MVDHNNPSLVKNVTSNDGPKNPAQGAVDAGRGEIHPAVGATRAPKGATSQAVPATADNDCAMCGQYPPPVIAKKQ